MSGILTGQVLATRIFGGQPPRARLQAAALAAGRQDSAPSCSCVRTDQPIDGLWLEHWLRDHVIGRIPGGRHAAQ